VSTYEEAYNKPQMQDLDFSPVELPSVTDTKDGSTCESLQSQEFRVTALKLIMLLNFLESVWYPACKVHATYIRLNPHADYM
jgi:hypothetical protein